MPKALYSSSAAVLLYQPDEQTTLLVDTSGAVRAINSHTDCWIAFADDWMAMDYVNQSSAIQNFLSTARLDRFVSLSLSALVGISADLTDIVVSELDDLLQSGVSPDIALSRIMLAPLEDAAQAETVSSAAASMGASAVAAVFDRLNECQPLLRRFAGVWKDTLCMESWSMDTMTHDLLWSTIVHGGTLPNLLEAPTGSRFTTAWSCLLFLPSVSATDRQALARLGRSIGDRLHPRSDSDIATDDSLLNAEHIPADEAHQLEHSRKRMRRDGYIQKDRALREITHILKLVRRGEDTIAKRFLDELIARQVAQGDAEYAIKSICNTAQRCKLFLRYDLERVCLDAALKLAPNDSWMLVQYGDHLKRIGAFDAATSALQIASVYASGETYFMAKSGLVDILTCQGKLAEAIEEYRRIDGWNTNTSVRVAIADCERRLGKYDVARPQYCNILEEWPNTYRAKAGLAEIDKQLGKFDDAKRRYEDALRDVLLEEDWRVGKCALASVMVQNGEHRAAFRILSEVIERFPFDMMARAKRAAILGIMGKEVEGLAQLKGVETPTEMSDWVRYSISGLLLLRSAKFMEGAKRLRMRMRPEALNDVERVADALGALAVNEVETAQKVLEGWNPTDALIMSIQGAIAYYIAIKKSDTAFVDRFRDVHEELRSSGSRVERVMLAIDAGRLDSAIRYLAHLALAAA